MSLLFGAALLAAYQIPVTYNTDLGKAGDSIVLQDFFEPEASPHENYRWSSGASSLTFPAVPRNRSYQLSLRMAAGPRPEEADSPDLTILANDVAVQTIEVQPEWGVYKTQIGADVIGRAADLRIDLHVPPFNPSRVIPGSRDDRELGVLVDWVVLQPQDAAFGAPALPPPLYALGWLAAGWLWYALGLQAALADKRGGLIAFLMTGAGLMTLALTMGRPWVSLALWAVLAALAGLAGTARQLPGWLALARARKTYPLDFLHTLGIADSRTRVLVEILLVGVITIHFLVTALWPLRTHSLPDFISYYSGAGLALEGGDYYDPARLQDYNVEHALIRGEVPPFLYPPFALLLFLPLALFPIAQAKLLWLLLNLFFLVAAGILLVCTIRRASPNPVSPVWLALMLSFSRPLRDSLGEGQVGPLILLLLAVGLWGWSEQKEKTAGIAIALAAAIKFFPGLLLLLFLWRGARRALMAAVITTTLLLAASLFVADARSWGTFLGRVLPAYSAGLPNLDNQSPNGLLERFFQPEQYWRSYDPREIPDNLWARAGTAAAGLGFALVAVWQIRRPGRDRPGRQSEFAVVCTLLLLVSPLVWEHYLMWLILPLYLILDLLANRAHSARTQVMLAIAAAAVWLMLQYGPELYRVPYWPVALMSLGLFSTVFTFAGLCYLADRPAPVANSHSKRKEV